MHVMSTLGLLHPGMSCLHLVVFCTMACHTYTWWSSEPCLGMYVWIVGFVNYREESEKHKPLVH